MTHYFYKKITDILVQCKYDSDSFRALLTRPTPITKDGNDRIWGIHRYEDLNIAKMMDELENDWVDSNQDRADRGLGITDDIVSLCEAMIDFICCTNAQIEGRGVLYESTRARVSKWMGQAGKWYQDIKKASSKINVKVDRERLRKCFKVEFSTPNKFTGKVRFDELINKIEREATTYTITDIGRIAHQIWKSSWASTYIRKWKFAQWIRVFCQICNVPVPKDTAPTRYKTITPGTDFSVWLNGPQ